MKQLTEHIRYLKDHVNIPLLIFLVGIMNIKLPVKVASVVLYAAWLLYKRRSLQGFGNRIVVFYALMAALAIISVAVQGVPDFSRYSLGLGIAVGQWLLAGATIGLIGCAVREMTRAQIVASLKSFFLLNAAVSLIQLITIAAETGAMMPYWDISNEKYGISTGDYIYGIFFYHSILNAAVNALGVVYFIFKKSWKYALLCLAVTCMGTSNLMLLATVVTLVLVLITGTGYRKPAMVTLVSGFLFYVLLSPHNFQYLSNTTGKQVNSEVRDPEQGSGPNTGKQTYAVAPADDCIEEQVRSDRSNGQGVFNTCYADSIIAQDQTTNPLAYYGLPGKVFSFYQTIGFLGSDWQNLMVGSGPGLFSSKLALKMTGLNIQGTYPQRYVYIGEVYSQNHLYTMLYYLSQPLSEHSVLNFPNSIYNHIAGEYGLIGILLVLVIYLGYFVTRYKSSAAAPYLIVLMMALGVAEYWFEMISLTLMFETMVLSDVLQKEEGSHA